MAKAARKTALLDETPPPFLVRDPKTGEMLEVRGAGALKGQLLIREDIDLTKPIFEQVMRKPSRKAK